MSPFAQHYASSYDTLYQAKDYKAECDLIEEALKKHTPQDSPTALSLLDLGCGTGGHSIELAWRGHNVTGVDLSEGMLQQARAKADSKPSIQQQLCFHQGNVASFELPGQTFDAAIMMFAVLGYQNTNENVLATFRNIAAHLKPGALFLFDVWYGPAVLMQQPGERVKTLEQPGSTLIRAVSSSLDSLRHTCTVHYKLWTIANDAPPSYSEESHTMRYFFPQELPLLLEMGGLQYLSLTEFPSIERPPSPASWNVLCVARKPA